MGKNIKLKTVPIASGQSVSHGIAISNLIRENITDLILPLRDCKINNLNVKCPAKTEELLINDYDGDLSFPYFYYFYYFSSFFLFLGIWQTLSRFF